MTELFTAPAEWSRFGLGGMVIGALFGQIAWFLSVIKGKDKSNQSFIQEILNADRLERQEDRREHRETTNRLADAIGDLTKELQSHKG